MNKPHWSEKEIQILQEYYSTRNKEELLKFLPGRSWTSISHRASRLGQARSSVVHYLRNRQIGTLIHDEAVYIAGLLDGEGMLTISVKGGRIKQGSAVYPLTPIISLTNSHIGLIEWLRPRLGGCTLKSPYTKGSKWKVIYTLQVARLLDIKALLEQTLPYLIVKRHQAELLLEFCDLRLKDTWMPSNPRLWKIAIEIRDINKKGPKMQE